jgi:L-fuculose-phosphate aldolase
VDDGAIPFGEAGLARLRTAMVAAGRRMGAHSLIAAGEGNLSIRLPGGRLLVTPSGLRKDELEPEDLVVVPLDADGTGADVAGSTAGPGRRPTSDLAIHRAIQLARPDVLAVAHAHPPATLVLTLAGERADPAALPETALLLPRLPFVPFGTPGSADLAARIAAALTEPPVPLPGAALLERHGAVAVGTDPGTAGPGVEDGIEAAVAALAQAVDRLELVEVLCRATRDALLIRAARRSGV